LLLLGWKIVLTRLQKLNTVQKIIVFITATISYKMEEEIWSNSSYFIQFQNIILRSITSKFLNYNSSPPVAAYFLYLV